MTYLFSEKGMRQLDRIVRPGLLCAFDFDGTLSPLVPQPDRARMPFPTRRLMMELSELAPVAIITGRSLADIRRRLEFTPDYLVGNHGLEGVPGWERQDASYAAQCRAWDSALHDALEDSERYGTGIWVENKTYSLSVHYRLARDHEKAERDLPALFATLSPSPRIVGGKCVFNLLPRSAPSKGMALDWLIRISAAPGAVYVGDDLTDEDAFALPHTGLMPIRVGHGQPTAARFYLIRQYEIIRLLGELTRRLREKQARRAATAGRCCIDAVDFPTRPTRRP